MRKLAVILVLFFPVAVFSQEKLSRSGYIEKYWRVAVEEMLKMPRMDGKIHKEA